MKLRKLQQADAPLMLEWMQDAEATHWLEKDFSDMSLEDCRGFIDFAADATDDLHLAIADDAGEYMGTVSLKHIDRENGSAEFAIVARRVAWGKGLSRYAMTEIIRIGLYDLGLKTVYWCVDPANKRAVCFYDKGGYKRVAGKELASRGICLDDTGYSTNRLRSLLWYMAI